MVYKNYFKLLLLLLSCSSAASLFAQTRQDSLHAVYDNRVADPQPFTLNPAVLPFVAIPEHGYADLGYRYQSGTYKRPMDPLRSNNVRIESGGIRKINQSIYRGKASYSKSWDKSLPFSNVYNSYNNNPFIWADSIAGDWKRDHLTAMVGITTPLIKNRLHAGLDINYLAGSGARMNDPKPYYRIKDIQLNPGVLFNINKSSKIGLSANGNFINEENELGYYNSGNNDVLVYSLRGFGTFSRYPFVNGERKSTSHRYYGNLHYLWNNNDKNFTASVHLQNRRDKITEGVAIRNVIGYYTEMQAGAGGFFQKGNNQKGYNAMLHYNHTDGRGDDEFFKATNTYLKAHHVKTSFSLWHCNDERKHLVQWTIAPLLASETREDKAQETNFATTSLTLPLHLNFRKYFTKYSNLQVRPEVAYKKILSRSFHKNNPNRPETVVDRFFFPWYEYLSANSFNASLGLTYEFGNGKHFHTIGMDGILVKSNHINLNSRTYAGITYRFTF